MTRRSILIRRQDSFNADRLVDLNGLVEPTLDPLDRRRIRSVRSCSPSRSPICCVSRSGLMIQTDPPQALNIGEIVKRAFARAIWARDDPKDRLIRLARSRAHRATCAGGFPAIARTFERKAARRSSPKRLAIGLHHLQADISYHPAPVRSWLANHSVGRDGGSCFSLLDQKIRYEKQNRKALRLLRHLPTPSQPLVEPADGPRDTIGSSFAASGSSDFRRGRRSGARGCRGAGAR